MGRSTASCFKIIACGTDSVDHDDLQTPESKVSSVRSGWSFGKRSARHRVLSNTIISEAPSFTDKESPESTAANIQVQPNSTFPEKASVIQRMDEKDKMCAEVDTRQSNIIAAKDDECSANTSLEEFNAVLIQAAIRGYLAQRTLLKQKNIIKLQAAVRGHLVRRHAVGTLRCALAIVKMQALVRARHGQLLAEGSGDFEKQKKNSAADGLNPTVLRSKREGKENGTCTYIKLLSNKFACQLMDSTPRTKSLNIKCDPVKPDSAWKWLERWMTVSSVSNDEQGKSGSAPEEREEGNLVYSDDKGNVVVPLGFQCEPKDLKSAAEPSDETTEKDDNLITDDADSLGIHAPSDPSLTSHPKLQNVGNSNSRYNIAESGAVEMREKDLIQKLEAESILFKDETGNQQGMHDSGKLSTELRETGLSDASIASAVAVQGAGSECGTELSITSTLDSPDMSDGGVYDLELEPKMLNATDPPSSREQLGREAFENSSILGTELSYANIDHLERNETGQSSAGECVNPVITSDSPPHEKKLESDQSDVEQVQLGSDKIHVLDESSPHASPRSHVTLPESQATSSSQVSLNPKKSNSGKISSNDKKKRLSSDKSSASTPNRDSPTQSSLKLEEPKSGKRRKSFGSTKLDHADQEPRSGSNRNLLPSYMQPTESARAKALSSGSPRSSPDVKDKDIVIKNKPNQPNRNEREGSPRAPHSPFQAQQNAKGNDTHSPQERKWLR